MGTRTLSLIVCTLGRPQQISSLLDSVLNQTRPPDEIIIVDASADDETKDVVTRIQNDTADQSLRYFRVAERDRGLTRQRNYGIQRANGNIVAFLDDDTIPEPDYFAELVACFDRHPNAIGVGGYIVNEIPWRRATPSDKSSRAIFRAGEWVRREDYRWRLRKMLGLASPLSPGKTPPFGHGRPIGFLPPDGADYEVEFVMGGASSWRSDVLASHEFSHFFEGYGLYEDMDFCIRASSDGPLFVNTRARLAHHHAGPSRPNKFRYGEMVVRNGWFVWRRRWPRPRPADRARWWWITLLLAFCRLLDVRGPSKLDGFREALGRFYGAARVLVSNPRENEDLPQRRLESNL